MSPVSPLLYRLEDCALEAERRHWLEQLTPAQVASPAVCLVSLLWQRFLTQLGISPAVVGGHSLGELSAFAATGAFDEQTLIQLAALRARGMDKAAATNPGTMASLACDVVRARELLAQILQEGYAVVANLNSPSQTVVSGARESIEQVIALAEEADIHARLLPVGGAFHSQMMAAAASELQAVAPISASLETCNVPLFSSTDGREIELGCPIREHFATQMLARVDFIALAKAMSDRCDLLVEVGSGQVLSGLMAKIPQAGICFPLEPQNGQHRPFDTFLGCYFVRGGKVNWQALYAERLVRPFVAASERVFIENPCERPFNLELGELEPIANPTSQEIPLADALTEYFHQRSDFLAALIEADLETTPLFSHAGGLDRE